MNGKDYLKKRVSLARALIYVVLVCYLMVVVYPMFWVVMTSLKKDRDG